MKAVCLLRNQNSSSEKFSPRKPLFHNLTPLEAYNDTEGPQ